MTPRQRVLKALRFEKVDRVPFTLYENKVPQCAVEREMRNRGMCIVNRNVGVFRTHMPNVKVTSETFAENGRQFVRTHYDTPAGHLTMLAEPAGFTSWTHERMFKSPDDYKALRFLIEDERYEPCYADFAAAEKWMGEDVILRAGFGYEPMQALVSGTYLGMETFCIEWMDHRDEVLALYEALVRQRRKKYPLIAASPVTHANYGGNVVPEIVSPAMFEAYYIPHYQEAAEAMHARGKLIGSHFDDDCGPLAALIAKTGLDYIEAFTPAPTTDMTLAEARAAWPKQALWLNFPSQTHGSSSKSLGWAHTSELSSAT